MYTKEELQQLLEHNVVIITFTKLNGMIRRLVGTLSEDILPESQCNWVQHTGDILKVWDIENNGWRNILVKSIIKVEKELL